MSKQFELDLQQRAEGPSYDALSDAELRALYKEKMGVPIPTDKAVIIEALKNPIEHLQQKSVVHEENINDLRRTYRV